MTANTTLKALVQGAYDAQKLRVSMGNRICQSWYQTRGVNPGDKPKDKLDEENKKLLAKIKAEYKTLTEGAKKLSRSEAFQPTPYLPVYMIVQLCMLHERLVAAEDAAFKEVGRAVESEPIYDMFLRRVTGCGPAMSGVMLATFDIHKANHPSQFWAFAGLDVGPDGRGRSKRKEHLIEREYTNREGVAEKRMSITFDNFLKTKLVGVLATCFLRNNNERYRKIYDDYKHRLENHPIWRERTPGHRNNAAKRYMIKMFLLDLWKEWRAIEGLPVGESYAEAKLGLRHSKAA